MENRITIEQPSQTDMWNLKEGQMVRINGQKSASKVIFVGSNFAGMQGPRGGDIMVIPSVTGDRIQTSRGLGQSNNREWVEAMEVIG